MTNTVTVTESNNTVQILEDAPAPTAEPWYENLRSVPTSSGSATVTADSTAHTKGAWTEIIASNASLTSALFVQVSDVFVSAANTATLIDVGIGASGSETAIAENIAVGSAGPYHGTQFVLPVQVASGARISVRSQAVIASDTASITIGSFAFGDASAVPTTVDVLGTFTASSDGTAIGSSYTEVVASTAQAYEAIVAIPSLSGTYFAAGTFACTLSVASGASGSETEIAAQTYVGSSGEYVFSQANMAQIDKLTIPAGTRLSAKRDNGANIDCCLIGVPSA